MGSSVSSVGPLEARIEAGDSGWLARAIVGKAAVTVTMYDRRGILADGGWLYGDEFSPSPGRDDVELTLHVKWDGCTDIDHGDCMVHVCDAQGWTELHEGVLEARAWALRLLVDGVA